MHILYLVTSALLPLMNWRRSPSLHEQLISISRAYLSREHSEPPGTGVHFSLSLDPQEQSLNTVDTAEAWGACAQWHSSHSEGVL